MDTSVPVTQSLDEALQLKALAQCTDDILLQELAKRNPMIVYAAARGIDDKGNVLMPTLMSHGGEMHVHALLSRLQMFIYTGSTTLGGNHG